MSGKAVYRDESRIRHMANALAKIVEKWYGSQLGGSLHDVYVVEIEGAYL